MPTLSPEMRALVAARQIQQPNRMIWCAIDPTTGKESGPFAVINGKGITRALNEGLHVFSTVTVEPVAMPELTAHRIQSHARYVTLTDDLPK